MIDHIPEDGSADDRMVHISEKVHNAVQKDTEISLPACDEMANEDLTDGFTLCKSKVPKNEVLVNVEDSSDSAVVFDGEVHLDSGNLYQLSEFESLVNSLLSLCTAEYKDFTDSENSSDEKNYLDVPEPHVHNLEKIKTCVESLKQLYFREQQHTQCWKHEKEISRLKDELNNYEEEIEKLLEMRHEQEMQYKTRMDDIKAHYEKEISLLKKRYEMANCEKESAIMKYAVNEKELMQLRKEKEMMEKRVKDLSKDIEKERNKYKKLTDDNTALNILLVTKKSEIATALSINENLREELRCKDIQTKWIEEQLRTEILQLKNNEEKYLEDVKQYEDKIKLLEQTLQERNDSEETNGFVEDDGDIDRTKQENLMQELKESDDRAMNLIAENSSLLFQVKQLEAQCKNYEETVTQLEHEQNQKIQELNQSALNLESVRLSLKQTEEKVTFYRCELDKMRETNEDLLQDMECCRQREAELLEFTEKLTAKNVTLQSENTVLITEKMELEDANAPLREHILKLEKELQVLKSQLENEKKHKHDNDQQLEQQLTVKEHRIENLLSQLEELQAENQSLKLKYSNSVRELTKELHNMQRNLQNETADSGSTSEDSICSEPRVGSYNSLNDPTPLAKVTNTNALQLEPDRQLLIEKIINLQRANAKYVEKVEFFEEHIAQLVAEIKKKTRILQHYILREQTGALSSDVIDQNKAEMVKYGGIMSLLYGENGSKKKQDDGSLSLDLSLEINRKLQAVLEDTILKNITLKENIETLGKEIERLSSKTS